MSDADCYTVYGVTIKVVLELLFLYVIATSSNGFGRVKTGFYCRTPLMVLLCINLLHELQHRTRSILSTMSSEQLGNLACCRTLYVHSSKQRASAMMFHVKAAIAVYAVLKNPALVEHALRQTLAADALSLQFKLPPPSLPVPIAQSSDDIAGGTLVVDALAVTSVWVVQLLRMLCSVRQASSLTASVHAELLKSAWHDCQVPNNHTVH